MNILIATDAWHPQVNGVVRTIDQVNSKLQENGHSMKLVTPQGRNNFPLPGYKEISLAWISQREISRTFNEFSPDSIHIATEGPIGWAVRRWCLNSKVRFTTSFHTQFSEYLSMRFPLPGVQTISTAFLKRFHNASCCTLSPTQSVTRMLEKNGFRNVKTWTRGVDHGAFKPIKSDLHAGKPSPVMVYMGTLAIEKGLDDFLNANVGGTKVVIGDGPSRKSLQRRYPKVEFRGYKFGEELTRELSACDIFVFPSKTDTFGLVLLEAMATGLPVAAYPVSGPIDVIEHGVSGWLDDNLATAIQNACSLKSEDAIARAAKYTWKETADIFLQNLVPTSNLQFAKQGLPDYAR